MPKPASLFHFPAKFDLQDIKQSLGDFTIQYILLRIEFFYVVY